MRQVSLLIVGVWVSQVLTCAGALAADPPRRLILVTGESSVEAPADQISLVLTVTTQNEELLEARAANDRRVTAIVKAAGDRGVAGNQMQTDSFDIAAQFDKDQGNMRYRVVRTIQVTIGGDLLRFEPLLADLLKQGGFKIDSISLTSSQLDRYRTEARRGAYADARQKGAQLAELDGQKLGKAWSIVVEDAGEKQTPFVTGGIPVIGNQSVPRSGKTSAASTKGSGAAFGGARLESATGIAHGARADHPESARTANEPRANATTIRPVVYQAGAKAGSTQEGAAKEVAVPRAASPALSPGRITVSSSVTIQFDAQ